MITLRRQSQVTQLWTPIVTSVMAKVTGYQPTVKSTEVSVVQRRRVNKLLWEVDSAMMAERGPRLAATSMTSRTQAMGWRKRAFWRSI